MTIVKYKGYEPEIASDCFIAPSADIIGQAKIGSGSSVWFGAVIRADLDTIEIGENTSVQDNCTLHVDGSDPMKIGNYVTIGHNAVVHSCTIEDDVLIGMGAVILNRAVIGKGSIIGAGCVVGEGKVIPPRSLVVGIPGKVVRELDEAREEGLVAHAKHYAELAKNYL